LKCRHFCCSTLLKLVGQISQPLLTFDNLKIY
jgi:hypothetical protein